MIPQKVIAWALFLLGWLLLYLVDVWRKGDDVLRLTRWWVLWLGRRHTVWSPSGCPGGISYRHGYYVRRWWRIYRRNLCLEPTGTLLGDLPDGTTIRCSSRLTETPSFRRDATDDLWLARKQRQQVTRAARRSGL